MKIEQLLELAKNNKKLYNFLNKENKDLMLFDITVVKSGWDAEDKANFDTPIFGLQPKKGNKFILFDVETKFAKLYNNYNWDGVKLSDGRLVFVTAMGDVYVVIKDKLVGGGVELTSWGLSDSVKEGTDTHAMLYGIRNKPELN